MNGRKSRELRKLRAENTRLRYLTIGAVHGDKAAQAEREACAMIAEGLRPSVTLQAEYGGRASFWGGDLIAGKIRARGK